MHIANQNESIHEGPTSNSSGSGISLHATTAGLANVINQNGTNSFTNNVPQPNGLITTRDSISGSNQTLVQQNHSNNVSSDMNLSRTTVSNHVPSSVHQPVFMTSPPPPPPPSSHTQQHHALCASIHSLHPQYDLKLNNRFMLMPSNDQIRELQTVIRDKATARGNFKFYADRLIRLVVEEGLNQLPTESVAVQTPTGNTFNGIRYLKGNCGVSIVRSGESMEQGLRDCCRSIRIGKILIESDENNQARVLYTKFPRDIAERKILLLYPIMSTGLAVIESVKVLLGHGVKEENLILLNLFSSPRAAKMINSTFPKMFALTSDINPVSPNHFGQRYFGTD